MKTVFILGAGASVEAGAPLMPSFLKQAKQLHSNNAYGGASQEIQDVLNAAYTDLRPIHAKSTINYQNIEELFSAIDIGQLIGSFGSRPPGMIDELRKSIVVFIYRTIEETVRIPFNGKTFCAPKGYDSLAKNVRKKAETSARLGKKDVSFITFNYDTCLEFSLAYYGLGIDYGLSEQFLDSTANNYQVKVPVYKLHGSINWATCPKCKSIVPTEIDPWRHKSFIPEDMPRSERLLLASSIAGKNHTCGTRLDPLPYIVPPTWNKSSSAKDLQNVWRSAAVELGAADNIVVIGYSLPPTDMFFKYLFALGSNSDTHLDRFIVINGNGAEETRNRFEALLGPTSLAGFEVNSLVFSGAGNVIQNVLAS